MPVLRRIVFGEPQPGGAQFAALLAKLTESVSYCNRTGPRAHDRITDVPFTVPALGLDFVHPAPLSFIAAAPAADDAWGIFAWHHMQLYQQAALAARLDPVHLQCVRLCRAIYAYPGDPAPSWDERLDTAGVAWGVKFEGSRAYVAFRGSDDFLDWLRDLTGFDPARLLDHDAFGPMWDGFVVGMQETWAALKPLVADVAEVIFTGHSLGAARAGVAAGYAILMGG